MMTTMRISDPTRGRCARVGGCARGGAREAVDGDLDARHSTLDARISTLESRISNLESRHRTVVDSIRFASIRSIRSFVRLAVTLARSVGTMSRERGDGGTTGANDESMNRWMNVSNVSRANVSNERRLHYSYNGADRRTDDRRSSDSQPDAVGVPHQRRGISSP